MGKKRVLFIEPEVSGHHLTHIQLLCEYILTNELDFDFIFLVNPDFREEISECNLDKSVRNYEENGIIFHAITLKEFKYYTYHREIFAALYKNFFISRYMKKFKPRHVCMLMGDHLQYLLDPLFFFRKASISGIIFRPSVHYGPVFGDKLTLKEKFKSIRKAILYQKMLLSPVIKPLFSLDPYFVEYGHKKYLNGKKLEFLPDISGPADSKQDTNYKPTYFTPPKERVFFFMFGQISKRKGILVLLKALLSMPLEFQQKTAVLIAGEIENSIKEKVLSFYKELKDKTKISIFIKDEYLSNKEIGYYVNHCSVVLIPYQKSTGSSGLLHWAIRAGKPVLTQNYGLVGKLVNDNKLGITLNTEDKKSVRDGMIAFLKRKSLNNISIVEYHKKNISDSFQKKIITIITK